LPLSKIVAEAKIVAKLVLEQPGLNRIPHPPAGVGYPVGRG